MTVAEAPPIPKMPHIAKFEQSDRTWNPRTYLEEYYASPILGEDETAAVSYQVDILKQGLGRKGPALEFGCGPTVMRAIAAAPYINEIHLADYSPANLEEVKKWIRNEPGCFNWNAYTAHILRREENNPDTLDIMQRNSLTREKITQLVQVDAGNTDPLGIRYRGYYPNVFSAFCADSATSDKTTWALYMRNIASLVSPGGLFFVAALKNSKWYKVGTTYFPSADIDEHDLKTLLTMDFPPHNVVVDTKELPSHQQQGYSGVILAYAIKSI